MARVAESTENTQSTDRWHRWLLDRRFGGDAAFRERELTGFLYPIRDTVLDNARLRPGDTLLDVGTGDGMIAFGALVAAFVPLVLAVTALLAAFGLLGIYSQLVDRSARTHRS